MQLGWINFSKLYTVKTRYIPFFSNYIFYYEKCNCTKTRPFFTEFLNVETFLLFTVWNINSFFFKPNYSNLGTSLILFFSSQQTDFLQFPRKHRLRVATCLEPPEMDKMQIKWDLKIEGELRRRKQIAIRNGFWLNLKKQLPKEGKKINQTK